MLRKNSGVTLLALVITIVILLILAGTATFTGLNAIENSRITNFRTEMEMIRLQLNSESELEKYKKTESDTLTEKQKNYLVRVQNVLNQDNISIVLEIDGFKYFTKDQIKDISNIELSRDLYINATTKTIVSSEGVKYDGKLYYMLEQLADGLYNIESQVQNSGDITFDVTSDKLNITVSNIEYKAPYVQKGTIQYKLSTAENWTTVAENTVSKNFSFEVPSYGEYDIRVVDAKNNELISRVEIEKTVMDYATEAIPAGASIKVGTTEETGIVMIDSKGNEWVWVEVPETVFSEETTARNYDAIKADLIAYATDYREGSTGQGYSWTDEWYSGCGISSSTEYTTLYQKMLSSVYTNKGFYIARYEAGIEGSDINTSLARTERTEITSTSPKAVSKQDMIPYNYVYCSDAQQLASEMATGDKTSSLLFGIQWDLVCKYLEVNTDLEVADIKTNSEGWGNYLGKTFTINSANAKKYSTWEAISGEKTGKVLLTTGATEYTNKMNIYDFAGNEWEWTLEHATTYTDYPCSYRGGYCFSMGSYVPASYRDSFDTANSGNGHSFRSSLY